MGEGVRVVAASESARAVTAGEARRQRAPRLDGGASVGAVWAPRRGRRTHGGGPGCRVGAREACGAAQAGGEGG